MGGAVRRCEQDVRGSRGRIRALNFRVAGLFTGVPRSGILRSSSNLHSREFRTAPVLCGRAHHSFEGCVGFRERYIIPVGKANSLGEAEKELIVLWHGT